MTNATNTQKANYMEMLRKMAETNQPIMATYDQSQCKKIRPCCPGDCDEYEYGIRKKVVKDDCGCDRNRKTCAGYDNTVVTNRISIDAKKLLAAFESGKYNLDALYKRIKMTPDNARHPLSVDSGLEAAKKVYKKYNVQIPKINDIVQLERKSHLADGSLPTRFWLHR